MYQERTDFISEAEKIVDASFDAPLQREPSEVEQKLAWHAYVDKLLQSEPAPDDDKILMKNVVGFSPIGEAAGFLHNVVDKKMSLDEARENLKNSIKQNYIGYASEFILMFPALRGEFEIRTINGVPEVVSPKYSPDTPIRNWVRSDRRKGAELEAVINFEREVKRMSVNSSLLYTSPEGWDNVSSEGLPQTQTHLVRKFSNGMVLDTTFQNSMTLSENIAFLRAYGEEIPDLDSEEAFLMDVPTRIVPLNYILTADEVVNKIKDIRGNKPFWVRKIKDLETGKYKVDGYVEAEDTLAFIHNESLQKINESVVATIERVSKSWGENATPDQESIKLMVRALGRTALTEIATPIGVEIGRITKEDATKNPLKAGHEVASQATGCDSTDSPSKMAEILQIYAEYGQEGFCVKCNKTRNNVVCGMCFEHATGKISEKKENLIEVNSSESEKPFDTIAAAAASVFFLGIFTFFGKN